MSSPVSNEFEHKPRPTTALQRVMEKLTNIGFAPSPLSSLSSGSPGQKNDSEPVSPSMSAQHLNNKIAKIIKIETKLIALKRELSEDFGMWATAVKKPGCQLMIRELSGMYVAQNLFGQSVLEKLDKIKLSLHSVNEREKKHKDLVYVRTKLIKQLRESEVRFGKNSSHTTLLGEKLEENSMNLEVLNTHCIRAIATEMKEAVFDYTSSLHNNLKFLTTSVVEYKQLLSAIDWDADMDVSPKWVQNPRRTVSNSPVAWPQDDRNEKENLVVKERVDVLKPQLSSASTCKVCKRNKHGRLITPCSHGEELQFVRPQEVPQEHW